jgi:hypothetical protein
MPASKCWSATADVGDDFRIAIVNPTTGSLLRVRRLVAYFECIVRASPSVVADIFLRTHQREINERSTIGGRKLGGVATASRAPPNAGLKTEGNCNTVHGLQPVGSALTMRSSLIWQLASLEGLGAAAGRPRVEAPGTAVIFDVQLLYMPNVSDFDE